MVTFKVLQNITCGFVPGEIRTSDEFPKGTDFERLIKLGCIRSTRLGGYSGPPTELDYLDQIEELQDKLLKVEETAEETVSRLTAKIKEQEDMIAKIKARNSELELQVALNEPKKEEESSPVEPKDKKSKKGS